MECLKDALCVLVIFHILVALISAMALSQSGVNALTPLLILIELKGSGKYQKRQIMNIFSRYLFEGFPYGNFEILTFVKLTVNSGPSRKKQLNLLGYYRLQLLTRLLEIKLLMD